MKIKLDENLPRRLVADLRALGHDVAHVTDQELTGRPDEDVWAIVQEEARFFITQDLDFSDVRRYRPGMHQGLLLVRIANPSASRLRERIAAVFSAEETSAWSGCFVVVTEKRIRVRHPG